MTENYFVAAMIAVLMAVFLPLSRAAENVMLVIATVAVVLGLLSEYGALPTWKG